MFGDKKPKKKWRRIAGFVFSIVSLVVLAHISITLITGRTLDFAWFTSIFSPRTPVEFADEFLFDVGRGRVFTDMDGAIASAGILGIQVLDYNGNETLRDAFRMNRPAISSNSGRAIAFDIGGTAVRVFDSGRILSTVEASGAIVSASINRNGWFTVNTQEGGGLRGVATVYNNRGVAVYRVNLSRGYVFSSKLSPDNRTLAVLNLTDAGSRIPIYHGLSGQDPDGVFVLPGELIVDMKFLSGGNLLVVSTDTIIKVDRSGVGSELFEFSDKRLGGLVLEDGVIVLHLLDYGIGHSGRLVRLDERGNVRAELVTNRELLSMSYDSGNLVALWSDGIVIYDADLSELPIYTQQVSAAGINRVLALSGGAALATGEHLAFSVKIDE